MKQTYFYSSLGSLVLAVGKVIQVLKSAKLLGWKQGEYVSVEISDEGREKKVVLRRIALGLSLFTSENYLIFKNT